MASNSSPHIPDHALLRRIGRGSYGEVWLARSATGAFRAVKIIHRDSFDHDRPYEREFAGIKQFEPISRASETQVDILHVGRNDEEGLFYYVMELADDQKTGAKINPDDYSPRTLRTELYQRGRLPVRECIDIGMQLTTALEHLHGSGLIHRDIKPSNIVFVNGTPKLADVGLVTTVDATKSFVGTEGYIPPDGPGTPQADLYSLGKVLYEISTGRDRLDFPELPTDLKDHPERDALVQFNEVVLKACDEDANLRYQSAVEMLADLWMLKSGKPLKRIRPMFGTTWLVTAMLCCGILFLVLYLDCWRMKESQPPQSAPGTNHTITAAPGRDSSGTGLVAWWKADGNALDSAGNNNGTLVEGAGFDIGKEGQAFLFNGAAACVTVPYNPAWAFGKKDFSIALWAKFSSISNYQTFLASVSTKNQSMWTFCLDEGLLQWQMDGSIGTVQLGHAKFNPVIGNWYHLAITRSGDKFSFYINGVEASSEIWKGEVPAPVSPLMIGNTWGGGAFNGLLDDIRIYNRALAPAELAGLAQGQSSLEQGTTDIVVIGPRKYRRSEFMINTSFLDLNSQANLVVLSSGNFLVEWHQELFFHCYGQIFNPQGEPMGTPFLLNGDALGLLQWGASPAPLPNGGFIAAWGEHMAQGSNAANARCFDSTGSPVGAKFYLDLPDWTSVASYTNGDFIAAGSWAVGPKGTNEWPVLARRFNSSGIPYGPAFQVGKITNGYAAASASYGTDGRFAFAWPSHTRNAMIRAYRSNEFSPFGNEFAANSITTSGALVSARYNSKNELIVVWRSGSKDSAPYSVFVRRFDSNMVAEASESKANEQAPGYSWASGISVGPNDELLVSWNTLKGDKSKDIYARLFDRAGNPVGHEFRVNQFLEGDHDLGWEACQHTAILPNGNFVVGWVGDGARGNGLYLTLFKLLDDKPAKMP
jgi:serine/threonine protein kinase